MPMPKKTTAFRETNPDEQQINSTSSMLTDESISTEALLLGPLPGEGNANGNGNGTSND
ncbi:unnamed protein product, partial [Amoebophrya sp. A25]|eukprot:GSA25T00016841001.1